MRSILTAVKLYRERPVQEMLSIIIVQLFREHPVQEGLDRVAMYNMSMLQVYNCIKKYMIGYIYIEIYV